MSTWVCEDFDDDFTQQIRINRITSVKEFRMKVLKAGTVNSGATFTFNLLDGSNVIFTETITSDFINTNLNNNGDRADLVFDVQNSFVINGTIDDRDKDYTWSFTSSGYVTAEDGRFMICRRQSDDVFGNVYDRTGETIFDLATTNPLWIDIYRWSKDSKE